MHSLDHIPDVLLMMAWLYEMISWLRIEHLYGKLKRTYKKVTGKTFSRYIPDENNMIFMKPSISGKANEKYFFIYSDILDDHEEAKKLKSDLRNRTWKLYLATVFVLFPATLLNLVFHYLVGK